MRPSPHHALRRILPALLTLSVAACAPAVATEVSAPPTEAAPTNEVVFEVSGPTGSQSFTMEQLQTLPATEGQGGFMSSTGMITIPTLYRGVALKDLPALLGIEFDETMGMTLTAEDGYSMTFSYDQVVNGAFTAYDPATGKELPEHDPLTAIIAYSRDGQPLDPTEDGTLRVQVVSATNNQVVDGHWTVKWMAKAEVMPVGADWTLELEGALTDTVDRASFQSCSAPSCHAAAWEDESAQPWTGVALWRLVGQVDDAIDHGDDGYNEELAASGYLVDVVATDGYTVSFDSQSLQGQDQILLAYLVNDGELPEKYFPLRLVGPGLEKSQMVGQVAQIIVHVPALPEPTAETEALAPAEGSVVIVGLVGNELSLTEDALRAMGVVTIEAEHPKDGMQEYEGVRLASLLQIVQVRPEATKVVFTASDGYSAEIDLPALLGCADCMLAFGEMPGCFWTVMPGQASGLWVKEVTKIEIQ
jgi:DMSO/TMAO reductase YedYZ molybdopterin-dependent catalytic subunit